ncbi:RNA-binding protein MEX3A, partial [Clarias magur]
GLYTGDSRVGRLAGDSMLRKLGHFERYSPNTKSPGARLGNGMPLGRETDAAVCAEGGPRSSSAGSGRCEPDGAEPHAHSHAQSGADGLGSNVARLKRWKSIGRKAVRSYSSVSKREGLREEPTAKGRVYGRTMPSLLVLSGIMEKNGGYGSELAASGFGTESLLAPPDEEEEESRALRVALGQLSLLGLGESEEGAGVQERSNNNNNNHHHHGHGHSSSVGGGGGGGGGGGAGEAGILQGKSKLCALYESSGSETKARGCNITECVPVPSSEHVAEIVGRQGCKIKALRAKTNTYIKTPVRGEEPVFLITGRKEDVALARREIISAAEHFSMLRASRNKLGVSFNGSPPALLPGQTTIQVRVPYRVVGLVVGPKGSTIKRIQQQTCTYIVTPSRDRDPVFEITGSPGNAERAREEIEAHIASRTGTLHDHNNENDCL